MIEKKARFAVLASVVDEDSSLLGQKATFSGKYSGRLLNPTGRYKIFTNIQGILSQKMKLLT
jgi:hypothetical protein